MEIPLPPSPSRGDANEYSPTQITSPHSDDEGNIFSSNKHSSSQDASPSSHSTSRKKSFKLTNKKRMTSMLKSYKMTNKPAPKKSANPKSFSNEDEDDSVDGLLEAEINKMSTVNATIEELSRTDRREDRNFKRDKLSSREKERERERKLNIESIMEEETNQRKDVPRIDAMPNKAGSSFQRTMSAAGSIEVDSYHAKKAEESAAKLAASFANVVKKGPVVLDNFGFVSVQRPIEKPAEKEIEQKRDRDRSRSQRSRSRSRDRTRDKSDRNRDRGGDRGDRDRGDRNKKSISPVKKSDRQKERERIEERENEAMKDKYKLKQFPSSWKQLKTVEKLDISKPDFVKLKRAFKLPTRPDREKNLMTVVRAYQVEKPKFNEPVSLNVPDPVTFECESTHQRKPEDPIFHEDLKQIEYPNEALQKTKTKPIIDWCMNKKHTYPDHIYQYRNENPDAVQALKEMDKAQKVTANSNTESIKQWYIRSDDFLKEGSTGAVFETSTKKQKKIKKVKNKKSSKVNLSMIDQLEKDIKEGEMEDSKKDRKKKKKKKKAHLEGEDLIEDFSKKDKKHKKKEKKEKKRKSKDDATTATTLPGSPTKKVKKSKKSKADLVEFAEPNELPEKIDCPLPSKLMRMAGYTENEEGVQGKKKNAFCTK